MALHRAAPVAPPMNLRTDVVEAARERDGRRGGPRADFVPANRLAGSTGGELLGQWLARVLAISAGRNPVGAPTNPPLCLQLGRHGSVLAATGAAPEITCAMPVGMRLLVVGDGSECSSAEAPPYHGDTEAEQRACAINTLPLSGVSAFRLSLDGGPVVDIHQQAFLMVTPQSRTVFPSDPVFPATPGPATFVGAGYVATVPRRKLGPGRHVIQGQIVLTEARPETFSLVLDVVERSREHL
jgi:hypothetical protein